MVTSDITIDNGDIPLLAEFIYRRYEYDGLDFEIDAISKAISFLPELYPTANLLERRKMAQILRLQTITKFCHYAENVAAIAIAFKSTYSNEREEIKGIFKKIFTYSIGEIVDFYENMEKRQFSYIAKILGYPPIDLQDIRYRRFIESSSLLAKERFIEIGINYLDLRPLYNAYKHGYRVFIGENSNTRDDIFPFIDDDGKQRFTEIDDEKLKIILSLSGDCRKILECIIKQHHARTDYESKGGGKQDAINTILFFRRDEKRPTRDDLHIFYPNRGERLKSERTEAESIYNIFKEKLETEDNGKIVAIDMDSKKILAKDYDLNSLLSHIRNTGSSGRIHVRRISKNGNVGVEIY